MIRWVGALLGAAVTVSAGAGCAGERPEGTIEHLYLQSVDRQVECEITFEFARCLAKDAAWKPPASAPTCTPPEIPTVQLDRGNQPARFTCWSGVPPPKRDGPLDSQEKGSFASKDSFECGGVDNGRLSCIGIWWSSDSEYSTHGFTISPDRLGWRPTNCSTRASSSTRRLAREAALLPGR